MTKKMFVSFLFSCVAVFAFTLTTMAQDEAVVPQEDTAAVTEEVVADSDVVFDGMVTTCGPAINVDGCGCDEGFVGEGIVEDCGACNITTCAPAEPQCCGFGHSGWGKRGCGFSGFFRPRPCFQGGFFFNHCRPAPRCVTYCY